MPFARFAAFLFALSCMPQLALAQVPLVGSYEVTNVDGSPLSEEFTFTLHVEVTPSGEIIGTTYADNGGGPVHMPGEDQKFKQLNHQGTTYSWTNAGGTFGMVYWHEGNGQWQSVVLTGQHEGRETAFQPI